MNGSQLKRMAIVIAVCAAVGALAGIAGSAAAPSGSKAQSQVTAKAQKRAFRQELRKMRALKRHAFRPGFRRFAGPGGPGMRGPFGGPVHATAVIPNQAGTGFDTITEDAGTLNSVDGTTVHVKEATDKATYKDDLPIDVGGSAKVIRNGQDAKLSDLVAGDHVRVITGGPRGNVVIAADDAWIAQQKKRFSEHGFGFGFRHGGPDGDGPPPPRPGAPAPPSGSNQNGSNPSSSSGASNS